jgi:hydroxymethylbilane synthase
MDALLAERAVLEGLGGSCHTSVAVHAAHVDGGLAVQAELLSPDGRDRVDARLWSSDAPRALGLALADQLLAAATPAIRASLEAAGRA